MRTELDYIVSAQAQYRAMFNRMALGGRWNIHKGACGPVLLIEGATMDVDLPILVRDIQGMAEQTMINKVSQAFRSAGQ